MVSITSVISFVIVLLAASSYSAPIDKQPDNLKLNVKNPKVQPVVNQPELIKEPTNVPIHHKDRSLKEKESHEMTTPDVTFSPRGFETKESDEVTTEHADRPPRALEGKDSDEMTTDGFTRSPREFEGKESDEVTTERINRPVRSSEEKDSDEITTTEAFTRPPRGLESDEMTTEGFTRPPREFEGKESDEVTTERINRPIRILKEKDSDEITTTDGFTRPPREVESDEMTTEGFTRPTRQSDGTHQPTTKGDEYKRTVEDFLFTTLESSIKFNQRAIRPVESQEELESSSPFPSDKKKKNVDDEPSSLQSFGKSTGLLKDETNDRTNEEFRKVPTDKNPRLTETVPIIPDKISETKIDTKSPSKKSFVPEPVEQEQLSQVQHQPNIEKTKPDN